MEKDYRLIKNCGVDDFPFREGDDVLIKWNKNHVEKGVISTIYTSLQWGVNIVHAVCVRTDNFPVEFVVNANLLEKIK